MSGEIVRLPAFPKRCFSCDNWRSNNEEEQLGKCLIRENETYRNFSCAYFLPAEIPF